MNNGKSKNNKSKINIRDRVVPKKTGVPCVGTVVSLMDCKYFQTQIDDNSRMSWELYYPDWREQCDEIAVVKLDKAQRPLNIKEFVEAYGVDDSLLSKQDVENLYLCNTNMVMSVTYPVCDLELEKR